MDVSAGTPAKVREVPITRGRELRDVKGTLDEILAQAADVGDAYLRVFVDTDGPVPGIADRVRDELPNALDVHLVYERDDDASAPAGGPVSAMAPREQFVAYYRAQHKAEPDPVVLEAFDEVLETRIRGDPVRPLHLKVKSFTSFRDEIEIDFTDLDLFAIVGPTGSGKSSLLDAMTYALFGTVERVGKQCGQLVSQGQKRMAVTLDFAVGEHRFRVTRSTSAASGGTTIRVERWNGTEFVQAGEGADKVRPADAMIREFVGLDYDAFTRAVLLPQGQFADFLVGEAKDRRDILTELLGLRLFERLAKRAGELRRDAKVEAETKSGFLAREFEGVTAQAVAEAKAAVKGSRAREKAATKAEKQVREIAKRGERAQLEIAELAAASEEAAGFAGAAHHVAQELGDLADRTKASKEAVHEAANVAAGAAATAAEATAARERAESEWGGSADLAAQRVRAEGLADQRARLSKDEKELGRLRAAAPRLAKALEGAEGRLAKAGGVHEKAIAAVAAATDKLDLAQHRDLVATVRSGVKIGDPCPICGAPVEKLTAMSGAGTLDAARKGRDDAVARAEAADLAVREQERVRDAAAAERDRAAADLASEQEELASRRDELAEAEALLAEGLGGDAAGPAQAIAALDQRIRELETLSKIERGARRRPIVPTRCVSPPSASTTSSRVSSVSSGRRSRLNRPRRCSLVPRSSG